MELSTLIQAVLAYLTPSEQAVYLRLCSGARAAGTCAVRYDDLAHSAHISDQRARVRKKLRFELMRQLKSRKINGLDAP